MLFFVALILSLSVYKNSFAMQPAAPQKIQEAQLKMLYLKIPIKELEEYIRLQNDIDTLFEKISKKREAQKAIAQKVPALAQHAPAVSEYRALYNETYGYSPPLIFCPSFLKEKKS